VNDGLGDLGSDAADDTVRTHQPGRRDRLDQVLRHQGIHRRDASDIDDRDFRSGFHDPLEERFHDDLGSRAVQRPDHGKRQNAFPQLDHRGRQLKHLLLLPGNDLLARFDEGVRGMQAQFIQ
jgi:hypothetical protein